MNPILEQKLTELVNEADRLGASDAYVVLHLLLGAYQSGQQRKFARHCCGFSDANLQPTTCITERPEEFGDEAIRSSYYQ